jgi:putative hydrolase of the HAD superfamily
VNEPRHKAILCDIDGVLRHWPPTHTLDLAHGLPPGTFAAAAFAPERLTPAITGQITDDQWRTDTETALAAACGSTATARTVVTAWTNLVPDLDTEILAMLRTARRTLPVALVSNATTRLEHDLTEQGLGDFLNPLVNTARIGYAKPHPRVYITAAQRVGTPIHQCLFVDDTAANVEAARGLGMPAIHYRRPADLYEALAHLLQPQTRHQLTNQQPDTRTRRDHQSRDGT